MLRSVRIEYPGARYHVINRGNYRQDLFTIHKTGEALEKALFELVAISEAKLSRTTGGDFALSLLKKGLRVLKKKNEDIKNDRKGSEWKGALAYSIKGRSSVTNQWISDQLNMGDKCKYKLSGGGHISWRDFFLNILSGRRPYAFKIIFCLKF